MLYIVIVFLHNIYSLCLRCCQGPDTKPHECVQTEGGNSLVATVSQPRIEADDLRDHHRDRQEKLGHEDNVNKYQYAAS